MLSARQSITISSISAAVALAIAAGGAVALARYFSSGVDGPRPIASAESTGAVSESPSDSDGRPEWPARTQALGRRAESNSEGEDERATNDEAPGAADEEPSSPFDASEEQPAEARVIVKVGDLKLGVFNDAHVRDEAALRRILIDVARDVAEVERAHPLLISITDDGTEDNGRDFDAVLRKHREELEACMDGDVVVSGPGDIGAGLAVGPDAVANEETGEGESPKQL